MNPDTLQATNEIERVHNCAGMGIRFHADPEQIKLLSAEIIAAQQAPEGVFYVLESFSEDTNGKYWAGNTWFNFNDDIRKAIQYRRRQDAEGFFFEKWRLGSDVRVAEHMIIDGPTDPIGNPDTGPTAPPAAAVCTCPSGDGSLQHPCPTHPPAVAVPVEGGNPEYPNDFHLAAAVRRLAQEKFGTNDAAQYIPVLQHVINLADKMQGGPTQPTVAGDGAVAPFAEVASFNAANKVGYVVFSDHVVFDRHLIGTKLYPRPVSEASQGVIAALTEAHKTLQQVAAHPEVKGPLKTRVNQASWHVGCALSQSADAGEG